MGKNRICYLGGLLGCTVFYIAYREWLSWLLLVGVLWLPWLSLLVSLPLLLGFRTEVRGPGVCWMGQKVRVALEVPARGPVPPYGGRLYLKRMTTGETWRYSRSGELPTDHCGCILVQPERVWVSDVLGLFRFRVRSCPPERILVRPEPLAMDALPELDRYLARSWRPKPGGGYSEQHELRLYRPGDSLNQVHWKLTAKTGKLMIREPQEPQRGLVLLTLDLRGTPPELDRKLGRLLWLGNVLLEKNIVFEIRALTGDGLFSRQVTDERSLAAAVDDLLAGSPAREGSVLDREFRASWHRHIGGEPDES